VKGDDVLIISVGWDEVGFEPTLSPPSPEEMAKKKKNSKVRDYRHEEKRKNNPHWVGE